MIFKYKSNKHAQRSVKQLFILSVAILACNGANAQNFPGWEAPVQGPEPVITNNNEENRVQVELRLSDAIAIMQANNNSIKQADKAVEIAKITRQKLNSLWFPFLSATGMYTHFSQDIKTKNTIGEIASEDGNILTPIKEALDGKVPSAQELVGILNQIFPSIGAQEIAGILQKVGSTIQTFANQISSATISVPIIDQNIASADLLATWPVFTGGKRIYSSKIGTKLVEQAENLKGITNESQTMLLISAYYSLKLSKEVIAVREQNLKSMTMLYNDAVKLKDAGMINKAEMLAAQVAMENAIREYENSNNAVKLVNKALKNMLNLKDSCSTISNVVPTTGYSNIVLIPDESYFNEQLLQNSKSLYAIELQEEVVKNRRRMAVSGYMPNIGVYAKQNVYSYHMPKNLAPRTVLGAGVVWNIFDGLNREMDIKLADAAMDELAVAKDKIYNELTLAVRAYLTQTQDAVYNIKALESTIELCNELINVRQKSFKEGMSTTTDVVNAQTALANAQLANSLAYFQYSVSLANLMIIWGIGEEYLGN